MSFEVLLVSRSSTRQNNTEVGVTRSLKLNRYSNSYFLMSMPSWHPDLFSLWPRSDVGSNQWSRRVELTTSSHICGVWLFPRLISPASLDNWYISWFLIIVHSWSSTISSLHVTHMCVSRLVLRSTDLKAESRCHIDHKSQTEILARTSNKVVFVAGGIRHTCEDIGENSLHCCNRRTYKDICSYIYNTYDMKNQQLNCLKKY